jgi:peptide-methionine (S)-S-oxide reductase
MFFNSFKRQLPTAEQALPGRTDVMPLSGQHYVSHNPIIPPFPDGIEQAIFGLGCFWGAERRFWQQSGVFSTAVGYAGGLTPNPTYQEVCTGQTGHTEAVLVMFDPIKKSYQNLLELFWESHDPTQGMRQGNDHGTQYRSVIYCFDTTQMEQALQSKAHYQERLLAHGYGTITTEIQMIDHFYYAEEYHQQYLAKNPGGYCGLKGTEIKFA